MGPTRFSQLELLDLFVTVTAKNTGYPATLMKVSGTYPGGSFDTLNLHSGTLKSIDGDPPVIHIGSMNINQHGGNVWSELNMILAGRDIKKVKQ